MPIVYALRLEEDKYYVGYTARPIDERLAEHLNGEGAEWTKLYRPLSVLETRPSSIKPSKAISTGEENRLTLEMMQKYGWQNVRGGRWCRTEMSSPPPELSILPNTLTNTPLMKNVSNMAPHERTMLCASATFKDVCDKNTPLGNAIYHFSMQHKLWKAILSGEILFEGGVSLPSKLAELKEYIENNREQCIPIFSRVVNNKYISSDVSGWLV